MCGIVEEIKEASGGGWYMYPLAIPSSSSGDTCVPEMMLLPNNFHSSIRISMIARVQTCSTGAVFCFVDAERCLEHDLIGSKFFEGKRGGAGILYSVPIDSTKLEGSTA